MSDGGYDALMAAVRKGGPRAPDLLYFDKPPEALTGVTFGMEYTDSEGRTSRRWVTVQSVDTFGNVIKAYCWKRREMRSFRLDRIVEVVDGNGEVLAGEDVFELSPASGAELADAGSFPDPDEAPPGKRRMTRKERRAKARKEAAWGGGRREPGDGPNPAVVEAIKAERDAREAEAAAVPGRKRSPFRWSYLVFAAILLCAFAADVATSRAGMEAQKSIQALFGFLMLASILGGVLGIIKPALVLPWADEPKRAHAVLASVVSLIATLIIGIAATT